MALRLVWAQTRGNLAVQLAFEAQPMTFQAEGEQMSTRFVLIISQLDARGRATVKRERIRMRVPRDRVGDLFASAVPVSREVSLLKTTRRLRIAVVSPDSGAYGTVTAPVEAVRTRTR